MLSITRNYVEGYWLNIFCSLEFLFLLKDYFSLLAFSVWDIVCMKKVCYM